MKPENTPKSDRKAPKTAWKPGQSGNPGGRPRVREEIRERAQAAVTEHVIDAWVEEVKTRGDDWVKCSELLAHYGIGKPASAPEDLEAVQGPQASRELVVKALRKLAGDE